MKEDAMGNGQLKPAYNLQHGVDHIRHSKSKTGYVSEKTIYKCEDCKGCPYKSECIKGNHCKTPAEERPKTLQVAKTFLKHRKEDLNRICSSSDI